jgi:hypothetical protein
MNFPALISVDELAADHRTEGGNIYTGKAHRRRVASGS